MQSKEEFIRQLLEQQIFDELKEGYFGGCGYIRAKYEGTGIDASRVYRRIVNYRIKKYGTSTLENPSYYTYYTREDRIKQAGNIRQAKYIRRRNENL